MGACLAFLTIMACFVGAAVPLYYGIYPVASISAGDVACISLPGVAPFVFFAYSAWAWRRGFGASLTFAFAAGVAVAAGNAG